MSSYAPLLAKIFDAKTVAVLVSLLRKNDEFGVREIAREAGVSAATTYRIIQKLTAEGIVGKRKQGKSISYRMVRNTNKFAMLHELIVGKLASPLDVLKDEMRRRFKGRFEIVKSGTGKDAKVIIVSNENVAVQRSDISAAIEAKTGQKLAFVCMPLDVFKQMRAAGMV